MGTALASLTAGNLEAMAGQMVVAFTTTIIGLTAGTIAYVVQVVRHSWVNQTVREQRFLAESGRKSYSGRKFTSSVTGFHSSTDSIKPASFSR